MIVALTGFMASGKTTFGRAASIRLGWDFMDLDKEIEHTYGPVRELFSTRGEGYFREVESSTLRRILNTQGNTILALGGGTILAEGNVQAIRDAGGRILWLNTSFDIIMSEIGNSERPLVKGRSRDEILALYNERIKNYRTVADAIVSIDSTDWDKAVDAIVNACR